METECRHCKFISEVFPKDLTDREYWIMTEMFVHLHGADYCNQNPTCYKDCGETKPSGGVDNICLNCGSGIKKV